MDRRGLLRLAAGAAVLGAAQAAQAQGAPKGAVHSTGTSGKDYGPALQALRGYAEEHRRANNLPGLVVMVADAEGYVAELDLGYANLDARQPVRPDHLFQIGSISKSFAGICILQQVERGKLSLDTEVRDILPQVRLPVGARVTIQNLLNHTSGLPADPPMFPRVTGGDLWLGSEPGSRWSYSNLGYDLLGEVVAKLSGKTFGEACEADVLRPLGMTSARPVIMARDRQRYAVGYSPLHRDQPFPQGGAFATGAWVDVTFAAGSIAATGADMAKYIAWLIRAKRGQGGSVLSDASAKLYFDAAADAPGWAKDAKYASGMALVKADGRTLIHHTGGMVTFSSSIHVDAEAGVGCFASTNSGGAGYRPRAVTLHACALWRAARDGKPAPKPTPAITPIEKSGDFVGSYRSAAGDVIEVKAAAAGLRARAGGVEAELKPGGGDNLLIADPRIGRYPLAFQRKDKTVTSVWWGPTHYALDDSDLDRKPVPARLAAMAGRYDNDDPWMGVLRVVARPDGLYAGGTEKLTHLLGATYRYGDDDWSPERVQFDAPLDGQTTRVAFSGVDFLRRDD